jgi:hypothetical protein
MIEILSWIDIRLKLKFKIMIESDAENFFLKKLILIDIKII